MNEEEKRNPIPSVCPVQPGLPAGTRVLPSSWCTRWYGCNSREKGWARCRRVSVLHSQARMWMFVRSPPYWVVHDTLSGLTLVNPQRHREVSSEVVHFCFFASCSRDERDEGPNRPSTICVMLCVNISRRSVTSLPYPSPYPHPYTSSCAFPSSLYVSSRFFFKHARMTTLFPSS